MRHGTKELPGRPSVLRYALAAQVVQENQQIQVLKMAEHALDDGMNFGHIVHVPTIFASLNGIVFHPTKMEEIKAMLPCLS
jgi:hypothetical protein